MCDEAKLKAWADQAISRRRFGVLAGVAAVAACAPETVTGTSDAAPAAQSMFSDAVSFATADGTLDGFLIYPEKDKKYPGVIMWPDIAGVRLAKMEMAMRLASEGYAVLLVNPYYRDVKGEQFADFATFAANGGFQTVKPWRDKLTAEAIMRDATSIVQWLDAQPQVSKAHGIGTQGYCMGGPFTIWSAASVPQRIRAAASFHGGGLVRPDNPMSPHKVLGKVDAALLIAVAQDDDAEAPQDKFVFAEAAKVAAVEAEVEVYAGDHGWTVVDSPAYNEAAAEKAYANLLELYSAHLTSN